MSFGFGVVWEFRRIICEYFFGVYYLGDVFLLGFCIIFIVVGKRVLLIISEMFLVRGELVMVGRVGGVGYIRLLVDYYSLSSLLVRVYVNGRYCF